MGILLLDGFEQYNNQDDFQRRYIGGCNIEAPGRFGYGRSARSDNQEFRYYFPTADKSELVFGMAVRFNADTLNGDRTVMYLYGSGSNVHCTLWHRPNGSFAVCRQNDLNQIKAQSPAGLLRNGTWYYVEWGIRWSGSSDTGSDTFVRLNGVEICSATGVNLRDNSNPLYFMNYAWRYQTFIDDMYIKDDYTPLGDVRITTLVPSANTAQKDWTGDYSNIDELPFNTTDFNASGTVGALDYYELGDMPFTPTAIHGVQVNMLAQKDDANVRTIRSKLKSSAAVINGGDYALPSSWGYRTDAVVVNDPNTSAPWTLSGINAAQIGLEVVA